MAATKFGSCGSTSGFELVQGHVQNSAFKQHFVQCRSCGAVVSVIGFYEPGIEANLAHEGIKKVAAAMGIHVE